MTVNKLEKLKSEVRSELIQNILPFWAEKMIDHETEDFYGRIDGNGLIHPDADKGSVLNTRILWTFSAAYRILQNRGYLIIAERSRDYLLNYFLTAGTTGFSGFSTARVK